MEREIDKKLPFLDILLDNSHPSIVTSVYRKKTFTGLLTNYYKLGRVRTLLDRVYKINNSWVGFHLDVKKLIFLLRKNCLPSWVIDKSIHRNLSKKMNPSLNGRDASSNSGKTSTHFYKLPYVGRFSKIAQTKLRQLLKHYCKADLDVKLAFSTFKLRNIQYRKVYVRVLFLNSRVLPVMPATLARPLATFVHVLVSISCRTSLRMFTGTYSHLGPVMTLVIQNVTVPRSYILPPQNSKLRSKRHCTLSGKIPFLISS